MGGLAGYLYREGFDPWMLDWRSSGLVVDDTENAATLITQGEIYNFNRAAEYDIRAALACMGDEKIAFPISILGHCMGGGTLAEAVALKHISSKDVKDVVLMTLGLFYEVSIDGQLKCEDRVLERFRTPTKPTKNGSLAPFIIDPRFVIEAGSLEPRNPWERELEALYGTWPDALKAHGEPTSATPLEAVHRMCNRMGFMYGMVYQHGNLHCSIHGDSGRPGSLPTLFGAIPLQMFRHGANNIRQRQATFFDPDDGSNDRFLSEDAHDSYLELLNEGGRVTLITGALNRLWHRDSIDLMYEWLCRGIPLGAGKCVKHVLPTYGHQDLLWGTESAQDVFPKIAAALKP